MLIGTSQKLTKYSDVHAYVNGEELSRVKKNNNLQLVSSCGKIWACGAWANFI